MIATTGITAATPLGLLTVADLDALVKRAVAEALAAERAPGPRLLSQEQCARELGVSVKTLANYERRGCPVVRAPGCVPRYDLDAVLGWMKGTVK